jgi:hypothetical protein
MHLMYTVDDQGNRIYTLKVRILSYRGLIEVDVELDHLFIRKSLMWGKLPSRPIQVRHFSV